MKKSLIIAAGAIIALSGCISTGEAARIAACGGYSARLSLADRAVSSGALTGDAAKAELAELKKLRVPCLGEMK